MAEVAPYLWIMAPVGALMVNVAAQAALFRSSGGTHFMRSIILGFLAGLSVLALLGLTRIFLEGWHTISLTTSLLVDAPIYAALSYCYYNFVQLGQTSIRIRLYAEIARCPEGLRPADIARIYNGEALIRLRIQRLLESGDIEVRDGYYFIGHRRLVPVANIIFAAKRFLLGRESEFAASSLPSAEIP